jgi:thioredoxin reductase
VVEKKDAQEIIECDGVVIAVGLVAQESADLLKFLESEGIPSYVVGDVAKARRALNAVKEAAEAANAI